MAALERESLTRFEDEMVGLFSEKWRQQTLNLNPSALRELVIFCMGLCLEQGFNQPSEITQLIDAMLKDSEHPMSAPDMEKKAQSVVKEFRARALYSKLQALKAATTPKAAR